MKTLAFLGVAHIHTPSFIQSILERPEQFTIKSLWNNDAARASIAAGHSKSTAVSDYRDILRDDAIDAVIVLRRDQAAPRAGRSRLRRPQAALRREALGQQRRRCLRNAARHR